MKHKVFLFGKPLCCPIDLIELQLTMSFQMTSFCSNLKLGCQMRKRKIYCNEKKHIFYFESKKGKHPFILTLDMGYIYSVTKDKCSLYQIFGRRTSSFLHLKQGMPLDKKTCFLLAITILQDYNFYKKIQIHERFKFFLPILKKTCHFLFLLVFFLFQLLKFMLHPTFLGLKFSLQGNEFVVTIIEDVILLIKT